MQNLLSHIEKLCGGAAIAYSALQKMIYESAIYPVNAAKGFKSSK
jgi:hypothetical protein